MKKALLPLTLLLTDVTRYSRPFIQNRPAVFLILPVLSGCIAHYYSYTLGLCYFVLLGVFWAPIPSKKIFCLALLCIAWAGCLHYFYPDSPKLPKPPNLHQSSALQGTVVEIPSHHFSTSFILKTEAFRVKVQHKSTHFGVHPGQTVKCYGEFREIMEPRNPGSFQTQKYLRSKNVNATFRSDSLTIVKPAGFMQKSLRKTRMGIANLIQQTFKPSVVPLVEAMLLGRRSEIDKDQKDHFYASGLAHLLAISGLHVGVISLILVQILNILRLPRKLIFALCGCILITYIFITGESISVIRSSIMFAALFPCIFLERPPQVFNNLALACLICLMTMPYQILSLGFQLSFTATLFLLYYAPCLQQIEKWVNPQNLVSKYIISSILVSSLLFFVSLPPLTLHLNQVSPWSILANIPAIFLAGIMVLSACLSLLIFPASAFLGQIMGESTSLFTYLLTTIVQFTAELPRSPQRLCELGPAYTLCLYGILFLLPYVYKLRYGKISVLGILLFASCVFALSNSFTALNQEVKVSFIDVGQGDATLLELPGNYHILIDAGKGTTNKGSGKAVLEPLLRKKGIQKIDVALVTHGDLDHYGGFLYLAKHIPIKKLIVSDSKRENKSFTELKKYLEHQQVPIQNAFCGDTLYHYGKILLQVESPCTSEQFSGKNNNSLVTTLKAHQKSILFPGDIEASAEKWLATKLTQPVNILKVPHHGSATSSSREILSILNPQVAIISSGKNNHYGFPHASTLHNLSRHTGEIYNTGNHGAILFTHSRFQENWETMLPEASLALNPDVVGIY